MTQRISDEQLADYLRTALVQRQQEPASPHDIVAKMALDLRDCRRERDALREYLHDICRRLRAIERDSP